MVDGKPVEVLRNATYFVLTAQAGDVSFDLNKFSNGSESYKAAQKIIKVRPGYVYYLKVKVIPVPVNATFIEQVPHMEGVDLIKRDKMKLLK